MNYIFIYFNGVFFFLSVCQQTSSWVIQVKRSSQLPKTRTLLPTIYSYPGIFYEEQSECPEEDECEIDWDLMPDITMTKEKIRTRKKLRSRKSQKTSWSPNHHRLKNPVWSLKWIGKLITASSIKKLVQTFALNVLDQERNGAISVEGVELSTSGKSYVLVWFVLLMAKLNAPPVLAQVISRLGQLLMTRLQEPIDRYKLVLY